MQNAIQSALALILLISITLFSSPECSKGEYSGENVASPESQQPTVQAPQAPEELLRLIKEFVTKPNVNGYEFLEKVLGSPRTNWGPVRVSMKGFGKNRDIEWGSVLPSRPGSEPLPVPYMVHDIKIDKQSKFLDMNLSFYRNPSFLLTPAVAQKILGSPSSIYVTSPQNEFSMGSYNLLYTYRIEVSEVYELQIYFLKEGESNYPRNDNVRKRRKEYSRHTEQQINQEREWRFYFENHKDFLPVSMRLAREF
jgi:hypothetical protein